VTAKGIGGGAGIGGGKNAKGGEIKISGGTVTANGVNGGAGIGGVTSTTATDTVAEDSNTFTTGADGNAVIVASSISSDTNPNEWNALIFEGTDGDVTGKIYTTADDGSFTLTQDVTIPDGATLTVADGQKLVLNNCNAQRRRGRFPFGNRNRDRYRNDQR
jgi:hypothetical protein